MSLRFLLSKYLLVILFYSTTNGINSQSIVINEIMSNNESTKQDSDGDFSDWVELYNPTNQAINIKDYYISDNHDDLYKWKFPNILIQPNDYLIVFASNSLQHRSQMTTV